MITRASSAPVLHDLPDIIVTDHKGAMTEELSQRSENQNDELISAGLGEETSDSFVMPTSVEEESQVNRTPSVSPTLSRKSDGSTKSRQESAKEVLNTIAAVSIASSILDSRKTNQHNKFNKALSSIRDDRRDDRRTRFEKERKQERMYKLGQSSLNRNIRKKKRF